MLRAQSALARRLVPNQLKNVARALPTSFGAVTTQFRRQTDAMTVRAPHEFEQFAYATNCEYIDELMEKYKADKQSVDESWHKVLDNLASASPDVALLDVFERPVMLKSSGATEQQRLDSMRIAWMVRGYEFRGHLICDLDPLGLFDADLDGATPEELDHQYFGFCDADLDKKFYVALGANFGGLFTSGEQQMTLREIIHHLREVYCGKIGWEFMHVGVTMKRVWFREKILESRTKLPAPQRIELLDDLIKAVQFEQFLAMKYVGQKRFGLEGAETLMTIMHTILEHGANNGVEDIIIGIPHRGRLNVLTNFCGKSLHRIFREFAGESEETDDGFSGDVKYHLGINKNVVTKSGKTVNVSLAPNPSHLETVSPVVMGKVRAKQEFSGDNKERKKVVAVLVHGDASFSGQGVCYESMGLCDLAHFDIGGTFHIVVNNQVGFTTNPNQSRSAPYCTDLGKVNSAPIFHVNGDDVDSVARVSRLAVDYRLEYNKDVVIDLVCYRRHGHNESDDPSFTQPLMYKNLKNHPDVADIYANRLMKEGILTREEYRKKIDAQKAILKREHAESTQVDLTQASEGEYVDTLRDKYVPLMQLASLRDTAVSAEALRDLGKKITTLPEGFIPHKKVEGVISARAKSIETGVGIEWGTAEALAFGSLLLEGNHIRVSGQDVERGTFSQRHFAVCDYHRGDEIENYVTLQNLHPKQGKITIANSSLSEYGVCGYELGYSMENPACLVMWEAQFGDFANGAQVIFDQFISSMEKKWRRDCGLVVSLPHGYDGQGPEHSSGRIERFLQLSDDADAVPVDFSVKKGWADLSETQVEKTNLQVVYPSIPSNYFHLLRRQLHRPFRKPLIVFFSKRSLRGRHSTIEEFTPGSSFRRVIDHHEEIDATKLVFCTGQVYHWLMEKQAAMADAHPDSKKVALVRIEELAPFPWQQVTAIIEKYRSRNPNVRIVWGQEEPKNMGAYQFVSMRLQSLLETINPDTPLNAIEYCGRPVSAAPATGLPFVHQRQEKEIAEAVFLS